MFQGDIVEYLLAVDHGPIDLVHKHPNLLALVVKTAQAVANPTRMLARRATTLARISCRQMGDQARLRKRLV